MNWIPLPESTPAGWPSKIASPPVLAFALLLLSLNAFRGRPGTVVGSSPAVRGGTAERVAPPAEPALASLSTPLVAAEVVALGEQQPSSSFAKPEAALPEEAREKIARHIDEEVTKRLDELHLSYQKRVRQWRALIETRRVSGREQSRSGGGLQESSARPAPEQSLRQPKPPVDFARQVQAAQPADASRRVRASTPVDGGAVEPSAIRSDENNAVSRPGPNKPPALIEQPTLRYPKRARRMNRQAVVVVLVQVDETGRVADAVLEDGQSPGYGFEAVALEAAREAVYSPGLERGLPTTAWTRLTLSYRLR